MPAPELNAGLRLDADRAELHDPRDACLLRRRHEPGSNFGLIRDERRHEEHRVDALEGLRDRGLVRVVEVDRHDAIARERLAFSALRTAARTVTPGVPRRAFTTCEPIVPVAPVTKMFVVMCRLSSRSFRSSLPGKSLGTSSRRR